MKYINIKLFIAIFCISFLSCKKLLEVKVDPLKLEREKLFTSDVNANTAMAGIYYDMLFEFSLSGGGNGSATILSALSSDELVTYSDYTEVRQINNNAILPDNNTNLSFWAGIYKTIYETNAILEGLADAPGLSEAVKKQFIGEAKFVRAFCYFYLVNMYGAVPLITVSDYKQNINKERTPSDIIYAQILEDLKEAQANMDDNYTGNERIRPNKATATALLARVYLYLGDWTNAETESSKIINDGKYVLPALLDQVFPATSTEAIWQLRPVAQGMNTREAYYFTLTGNPASSSIAYNALTDNLFNSFDDGDLRKTNWIDTFSQSSTSWYYPAKYKVYAYDAPVTEYSIVFRLAEQYLIRSEARAQQDNIAGAKSDLDSTRIRAGIGSTTANDKSSLLIAIDKERRAELFTEWGHRWLDLKRRKLAETVLAPLKGAEWQATDTLYPLPLLEVQRNPNLRPQNAGY